MGYAAPTPIQEQIIPAMLEGGDLVGQAQTGTGKTAAFGIPLAETLDPGERNVQAVVLTPTRELAIQVSEELRSLCRYRELRVVTVYGGQSMNRQIDALRQGAHIVVGTPGRMLDHLGRGTLRLDWVRTAVLDEADEMLDIGFADDIERILRFTPSSRQTALFSATMPKPIVAMAKRYQKDALRISTMSEERGHGDISYQAVTVAPSGPLSTMRVSMSRGRLPPASVAHMASSSWSSTVPPFT